MKTAILLTGLSLMIGCSSPPTSDPTDGYTLYTDACAYHDSLGLRHSPAEDELRGFIDKGGIPGTNAVQLLRQEQKTFSLIQEAHSRQHWELPDNTMFSAETRSPYISSWLGINRAATAQAIELYLDGKPEAAVSFLIPHNTTGLKVSKAGTLIHILVHVACRGMQYPVLASSIDELPEVSLAEELRCAKQQYEQIPTICECMVGEQFMAINTAKGLFSDLRTQLKPNREKMVEDLKKAGFDDKVIKQIKEEKLLSVAVWESQVLTDLGSFQAFYTNALATRPSSELNKIDDEIEERIKQIGSGLEHEAAMAAWNLYMTNQVSGSFSMPDAERLHSQVGKAISQQFLSMMMPAVGAFGTRYREFIAHERLLLIRLAVRTYVHEHGKSPSTLQQLVDDKLLTEEMILDPLSGQTFLTNMGAPLEAYSVGGDLDDDNGVPWDRKTKSGDTILITLEKKWSVQQDAAHIFQKPRAVSENGER